MLSPPVEGSTTDRRRRDWAIFKRWLGYLKGRRMLLVLGLLGYALYGATDACATYLLGPLMNQGFVARDPLFLKRFPWYVLALFGIRGGSQLLSNHCIAGVNRGMLSTLRSEVFAHAFKLPISFYRRHRSSDYIARLTYNIEQLSGSVTDVVVASIQSGTMLIGLWIVMLNTHAPLTLLLLSVLPFLAYVMRRVSQKIRGIIRRIQWSIAQIGHHLQQMWEGQEELRLYSGETMARARFEEALADNLKQERRLAWTHSLGALWIQCMAALLLIVLIRLAADQDSVFSLTAGSFVTMSVALLTMIKPLRDLSRVNLAIQKGLSAAESVFDILDEPEESSGGLWHTSSVRGHLKFDRVWFRYDEQKEWALSDICLDIPPGTHLALMGGSGGGKSTLVRLLLRWYDPQDGTIELDGLPVQQWHRHQLRQQCAVVSQNIILFDTTIAENIALGSSSHDLQAIEDALKAAAAWDFINKLPEGLNTRVGERGLSLSGGQRQRIALARAFFKRAPILILDEATSALDPETEGAIAHSIARHAKDKTTLTIAHRMRTIAYADRIAVLEKGRIIEEGTHEALINSGGVYARYQSGA